MESAPPTPTQGTVNPSSPGLTLLAPSRAEYGEYPANRDVCVIYSLIKLEGVEDSKAANFYLGKKVAFVYRAKREVQGSKIRVIWGKVTRTHGMSMSRNAIIHAHASESSPVWALVPVIFPP